MSMDFQVQAAHVNGHGALRQYTQDSKALIDIYCLSLTHHSNTSWESTEPHRKSSMEINQPQNKKSQTSQRIPGLLTEDKIDLKPKSAIADVTKKNQLHESLSREQKKRRSVLLQTAHPWTCGLSYMWPQLVHSTVRHMFQCLPKRPLLLFPVMEPHCVLKAVLFFPYSFAKIHRLLLPSVDKPINPI